MNYPLRITAIVACIVAAGCEQPQDESGAAAGAAQSGTITGSLTYRERIAGEDGRLSGRANCNTYGAAWRLSGEGLTVEKARATLMACTPALDEQEREFLRMLAATHHFDITDDGALLLHTTHGATITARRE